MMGANWLQFIILTRRFDHHPNKKSPVQCTGLFLYLNPSNP